MTTSESLLTWQKGIELYKEKKYSEAAEVLESVPEQTAKVSDVIMPFPPTSKTRIYMRQFGVAHEI